MDLSQIINYEKFIQKYERVLKYQERKNNNNRHRRYLKYKCIQIYANKFVNLKKMNNSQQDINYVN